MIFTSTRTRTSSRYSGRISFGFLAWMVALAILASAGGVTYAVLKYNQVAVRTEINKLNREIAVCRINANQYRAKANALTNPWTMCDRLRKSGSELADIERIEIARTTQESNRIHSTASR